MFNKTSIQTNYRGLVGIRPSDNSDITPITAGSDLLDSDSGFFVNDVPGITYDILQATLGSDYSTYEKYLINSYDQTVLDCLTKFWNDKKRDYGTRELLENRVIIQDVCRDNKQSLDGRAIGFLLRPLKSNNIKMTISKVSMHVDMAGTFTIYFYNTKKQAPISTKVITTVADEGVVVDITDVVLYAQENGIATNEVLVVIYGYNSLDNNSKQAPQGMKGYSVPFDNEAKFINVKPLQIMPNGWNWNNVEQRYDLPLQSQLSYSCESFGMNLRVNVVCDFTDTLIDNKTMFGKCIQLAWACRLLWDAINSYEFNSATESKRAMWIKQANKLEMELYGYTDENKAQVKGYFQQLTIDTSGIDTVCMPCTSTVIKSVSGGYV